MLNRFLVAAGLCALAAAPCVAGNPCPRAMQYNWHANYAYTPYGVPTALVVPPTANLQTNWSWGAPSMRVSRIDHQFTRDYAGQGGGAFRHPPYWPQDTAQLGVHYVRGPWYPTQAW